MADATTQEAATLAAPEARIALEVDGGSVGGSLKPRAFSTGSAGFSGQLKVTGENGRRYQVSVNVVLIDSKPGGAFHGTIRTGDDA